MPHDGDHDDWDDSELDDSDVADGDGDDDADDEAETLPCPACRKQIYEQAEQCPYCGHYVTHRSSALAGRPWWFVLLGVLGAIAFSCYALW
jgi:hypothetical protein